MSLTRIAGFAAAATLAVVGLGVGVLAPTGTEDAQRVEQPSQPQTDWSGFFTQDMSFARDASAWAKIQEQIGKKAPDWTVEEWAFADDFKPRTMDDFEDQIVVIDFWGTWCPPCRAALPHTAKMHEDLADQDVAIIGICNTRGSETMASLATQLEAEFPMAKDVDDKSAKAYGVQWWPYYVVIDRDGIVRAAGVRPDKLDEIVGKLIKLQPKREKKTSTIAR